LPDATKTKRRGCGLVLLAALAISLLALAGIDAGLKSHGYVGYYPQNAAWVAGAADFPAFRANLAQTDVARRLAETNVPLLDDLEGLFREMTGMRPTPRRWRLWLGSWLLVARSTDGWGICLRPGVLMHCTEWVRRSLSAAHEEQVGGQGVCSFRSVFYAWRGRFLIVSKSPEYVSACLSSGASEVYTFGEADEFCVSRTKPRECTLWLRAKDGLPVSGCLEGRLSHRDAPLTLDDIWPEAPLLAITTSTCADLPTAFSQLGEVLGQTQGLSDLGELARFLARQWKWNTLPEGWDKAISECALAIMDIDTSQTLPVPEVALVLRQRGPLRGPHPLAPLTADADPLAYEWNEHPGQVAPLLGEKVALCLGRFGRDWLATSREPLMAALVGQLQAGSQVNADVTLRVNWRKLGICAERLVRQAAALELIPRMNAADAETRLIPLAQDLARLGRLQLELRSEDDRIVFEGFLAQHNN